MEAEDHIGPAVTVKVLFIESVIIQVWKIVKFPNLDIQKSYPINLELLSQN